MAELEFIHALLAMVYTGQEWFTSCTMHQNHLGSLFF